jgi:hypothetical protein
MPRFFQTEDGRFCELLPVGFTDKFLAKAAKLAGVSEGKHKEAVLAFCERVGAWPETKVSNGFPPGVASGSWSMRAARQNPHAGRGLLLPASPSANSSPEYEAPASFDLGFIQGELLWLSKARPALIKAARVADFTFDIEPVSAGKGWSNRTRESQKMTGDRNVPDFAGGALSKRMAGSRVYEPSALDAFGQATAFAVFTQERVGAKKASPKSGYVERLRGSDQFDSPLARASLFESEAAARERVGRVVGSASHSWTIVEVKIRAIKTCARSDPDGDLGELAHAMAAAESEELQGMLEKAKIDQLRERLAELERRVAEKSSGEAQGSEAPAAPSRVGRRL